jgi:tetratricopeptide (TPR) repeat protein
MHPKLQRVLTDPIILILSVLFLLQLYWVVDHWKRAPTSPADIVDRLSRGERIDLPVGDGTTIPIEAPRDENGKPIDIKRFLDASGPVIEKKLQEEEQAFGPRDPRTVLSRGAVAASLDYRGEHARAKALLETNYDIAIHAPDMPAKTRLKALQQYAEMMREGSERLAAYQGMLTVVVRYAAEAPDEASALLGSMANEQLQAGNLDQAESSARESLALARSHDQIVESQFFLTGILFRKGNYAEARRNAEAILAKLHESTSPSMQDTLVARFVAKMFAKMGDTARAEEIQAEFKFVPGQN